ncbi:MAG: 30S ribosome-binding factor RbfA [Gammaproteobacteria bacterium]|nr:30S ribosome-binding factor RbfA [Gammaproteobacteria bacterium]
MKKLKVERTIRIGELIRRELASILQKDFRDPRLGMVTFTNVKVSKDLSEAKIYFLVGGDRKDHTENTAVLNHAAGFLRGALAKRLFRLRLIPKLRFFYDVDEERRRELAHLIDTLTQEAQL